MGGILVLTGLSLLFPTFVSLATVRRKRPAEDEGDHQTDVIERVNEIYTAVVQSEECMEKIACEVGALAGDVGLTQSPALKLAGGFVPSKYKTYYNQFTTGTTATRSSAVPSLKSLIEGQKTISSNTNAISILSFYLIFLLSYQNIILLKKKQKKLSKMFSWTEQNH